MEHHSNIVPWMLLQRDIKFNIEYIPVKDDYTLDFVLKGKEKRLR